MVQAWKKAKDCAVRLTQKTAQKKKRLSTSMPWWGSLARRDLARAGPPARRLLPCILCRKGSSPAGALNDLTLAQDS